MGARNGSLKETVRQLGYNILDKPLCTCDNTHINNNTGTIMEFYGLHDGCTSWKAIIETKLGITCSEIKSEPDRTPDSASFSAELSATDRDFLQKNYWYEVEDGQTSPWNWRIGFVE